MAEVIVNVEQGKLKGKRDIDFSGNVCYSFLGIPFAKPPLGKLRFRDPQPVEPWEGIRDATKDGSACYQRDVFKNIFIGSEDCLFLNIYTPEVDKAKANIPKPVLFWIHGGAFACGSNSSEMFTPDYLLTKDVVLVTTNYRLGLLGFLKLEDPSLDVPGNAGLKDLIMALRWVKSNIHNFLGDSNNITIFGLSAGSAAVQYLLLSPLSKGLFHKAIMQSGSAFNPWASGHQKNDVYAQLLNLKTTEERNILQNLHEFSVEELLNFQEKLNEEIVDGSKRSYGPSPERKSSNAFLPEDPKDVMQSGSYNKVPLIIGYCDCEGLVVLFLESKKGQPPIPKDFENFVPYSFELERGSEESKRIAQKIKEFYYGDKEPSLDTLPNYINLISDAIFVHAIQKSAENAIKRQQPVFFYRFCFDGEQNFAKMATQCTLKGACHGDETAYLFKPKLPEELQHQIQMQVGEMKPGSPERDTMERLITLWSNFARFGNPNSKEKNDLLKVEWEPVGRDGFNYLNINRDLTVGINPEAERMRFWDELYEKYPTAKFW